jgi:hypothetical protein
VAQDTTCQDGGDLSLAILLILFDSQPEDIGWTLQNLSSNQIVISRPVGYYLKGTHATEEVIMLCVNQPYLFILDDAGGDGLCCDIPGIYSLQQEAIQDELVHGGGYFSTPKSSTFVMQPPPSTTTQPPVSIPSSDDLQTVTVEIILDDFPIETGWLIQHVATSEIIVARPSGYYEESAMMKQKEDVLLAAGELYLFIIEDSNENGLCCGGETPGSYKVSQGSAILVAGEGNFGKLAATPFEVLKSTSMAPTSAPGVGSAGGPTPAISGTVDITIFIVFDIAAEEIGWKILDDSSNVVLAGEETGTYDRGAVLAQQKVAVKPGGTYTFVIEDTGGNGLCCTPEAGTYLVALETIILARGFGNFGSSEQWTFTVPSL